MTTLLASFLRAIPQSNQAPKHISQIAPEQNQQVLQGVTMMLKVLGAIQVDDESRIKATSQTAKYLLVSLASYIEADQSIITDWHTRGIYRSSDGDPLQNAATLLHILESRRLKLMADPEPTRIVKVAQVLIKRTNPSTGHPELLFQFDKNAGQFQLIGGRHSDDDDDLLTTVIREIEEELASELVYRRDYQLTCISQGLAPPPALSPTFGALTQYYFWIYHMLGLSQQITLQPGDKWVPVSHALEGYVLDEDGKKSPFASSAIFRLIEETVAGGISELEDSFSV